MRKSLKNMVARDGVEPPTPAFSGLAPIIINLNIMNHLRSNLAPKCLQFWHQCHQTRYVLPKLYAAGWTDDQISEQKSFTDGRIVVAGSKVKRLPQKRSS